MDRGFHPGIKSPKNTKSRRTLAKRIQAADSLNSWPARAVALFVAEFGRMPQVGEITLAAFYTIFSELKMKPRNMGLPISKEEKKWRSDLRYFEKAISQELIRTIRAFDAESLHEFANSVAFLRGCFGPHRRRPTADRERLELLTLKYELARKRQKWTIRQVAKYLYWDKKVEQLAEDGFSALRRKCKALQFPLASDVKEK